MAPRDEGCEEGAASTDGTPKLLGRGHVSTPDAFWYATQMRVLRLVAPPLLTVQQWISELGRGTADTKRIGAATVKRMRALAVSAGAEAEFRKVSARSGHANPTH